MKKIFFALLFPSLAMAYTGTVQKVKGTRAIVEFERNAKIREGDMVSSEMEVGALSHSAGKFQNRNYALGLSFLYLNRSLSGPPSSTTTVIRPQIQFGFNFGSFEIGPVLDYRNQSNSQSSTGTTELNYGFYGQYYFVPNKSGATWVPYVGAKYLNDSTTSGSTITDTTTGIFVGLQWFPIGNNVCFQAALSYDQITSTGNNSGTAIGATTNPIFGPIIYF